ncbi:MAG: nicotinate-nucleotide--dimethylbenzimidazole phosphoribosyltransferase [Alphaproteobacteria bacterium]|nr:nicotinate-nucleotide--dimethylbenzimidazole phosphoribosyltransferase [Alphaproteobacteria bacterium]
MDKERAATLDEVRALILALPGPDAAASQHAWARATLRQGGAAGLGRLAGLGVWLAAWQARHPPGIGHPRVALFAGGHGISARQATAADETANLVARMVAGEAQVNRGAAAADADLRVYELALETPTADFTLGAAMTEASCGRALAYGMMAVEPGVDLLCLGTLGPGAGLATAALGQALLGGPVSAWAAGAGDAALLEAARSRHADGRREPFDVLARLGGFEMAAAVGAILAARMARVPVVLDGAGAAVAAAILWAIDRSLVDHCQVAHGPASLAHGRLLGAIGKVPLFDFGIVEPGVASGLAIALLRAAAAHTA